MAAPTRIRLAPDTRRAALITAAADFFADQPYDLVRLDEVAQRAGCSRALLYHYFPNKRALFLAVVQDVMDEIALRTQPGERAPLDRLHAALREYFSWARRNAARYRIAARAAPVDPEVRHIWAASRRATAGRLLAALPPDLRARREVKLLVRSWVSFTIATCLEWVDSPGGVSATRLADVCVATFVSALEAAARDVT